MKLFYVLLSLCVIAAAPAKAQDKKLTAEQEAAYTKTITQRAEKIVAALNIASATNAVKVRDIIVDQYRALNDIHTSRDLGIKALKEKGTDKQSLEGQVKTAEESASTLLNKLHSKYLSNLSSYLTPQQVEQVKDGMTYGVVPITYKGYVDMIPSLKEDEKKQILAWLVEAREFAMDAETSEKKHGWFGKYKGKINNYLSARGYNIAKEREEWNKRIAAKKSAGAAN